MTAVAAVSSRAQVRVADAARVRALRRARHAREVRVVVLVLAVVAGAGLLALVLGDYRLDPSALWSALTGRGTALDRTVVWDLRLPRVALAVVAGAAFGLAGGVFQVVFANPLASPDILGVSGGASVAAVVALLVLGWSGASVSAAAFLGAALVAAALHLVSRGRDWGQRFVLTGVGAAFLCSAVVGYLLTRAGVRQAQGALVWTVGSLGAARWREVAVVGAVLLAGAACLGVLAGRLRALQLGSEVAAGLGVSGASRVWLGLVAVGLVGAATSVVGPVGFVALAAPPLARRSVGTGSVALVATAATGSAMVLVADLVAQHALPGVALPTGVVTGAVGAPYLLWLLSREERR